MIPAWCLVSVSTRLNIHVLYLRSGPGTNTGLQHGHGTKKKKRRRNLTGSQQQVPSVKVRHLSGFSQSVLLSLLLSCSPSWCESHTLVKPRNSHTYSAQVFTGFLYPGSYRSSASLINLTQTQQPWFISTAGPLMHHSHHLPVLSLSSLNYHSHHTD